MLKTIIIDDEPKAIETTEEIIKLHCPLVQIIDKAKGVESGFQSILQHQPDVVLLDIQMKDGSGFDLLNKLKPISFQVIFVTAHEEYAIQAIKFSAIDYLLKPIDPDELMLAFEKIKTFTPQSVNEQIETLFSNMNSKLEKEKKIVLKTFQKTDIVKINDIVRCESHRGYTEFHLSNRTRIMVSKTLNTYYELLESFDFFKVHKSHFINLNHLLRLERKNHLFAIMDDGSSIPISTRKRESLLKYLDSHLNLLGTLNSDK